MAHGFMEVDDLDSMAVSRLDEVANVQITVVYTCPVDPASCQHDKTARNIDRE